MRNFLVTESDRYLSDLARQRSILHESLSWHGYLVSIGQPSSPLNPAAMTNLARRNVRWEQEDVIQLFAAGLSIVIVYSLRTDVAHAGLGLLSFTQV